MERKQTIALVAGAVVLSVAMGVLLVVGSGGSNGNKKQGDVGQLQEPTAPFKADYGGTAQRSRALGLPAPGRETFHVHARLSLFVDGKQVAVPGSIAFNPQAQFASALHTHDADGIIHLEADQPFEATVGDFFTLWGIKFSNEQLGGYKNDGTKTIQVFINGQPSADPMKHSIKAKDEIVVGYGAPGSFPTKPTAPFPTGL